MFHSLQPWSILICVCLHTGAAQSPSPPGRLGGRVLDHIGSPVRSALITAEAAQTDTTVKIPKVSAETDETGSFTIAGLPGGHYRLVVNKTGFSTAEREVDLASGGDLTLTFSLRLRSVLQTVTVTDQAPSVMASPTGQTITSVAREAFRNTAAVNISEVLALTPGVTTLQGNGPRDVSISIRGSNERQSYGVRNAQVFEDGFPVTQPDGLARTDLTDPHAYSSIDVVQGPSSALYGNYATGGAMNFHTRSGLDLDGLEANADFGSFGYLNDSLAFGGHGKRYDFAGFVSNARSNNFTTNNAFNTITANAIVTMTVSSHDRLTFKFLNNLLDTQLSIRLSLNQYRVNPYQEGCTVAVAAGCASVRLFANGSYGPTQAVTASQAGLGRNDRRTIAGTRWEHAFSPATIWKTQFVYDDRDISQPTGAFSYRGPYPSVNLMSDVTHRGTLWGKTATAYALVFVNGERIHSYVYNVLPTGRAALGGLTQTIFGHHLNTGLRAREELTLSSKLTAVLGIGGEFTDLDADETNFLRSASGTAGQSISANRRFWNFAPEAALVYAPSAIWRLHTHLGTGYGTPQATNLFVTSTGVFGNNTQLQSQKNVGIDLGAEWTAGSRLRLGVTGFYEWFRNELVSQSAGVNLQTFTFNAPASQHRGIVVGTDWRPFDRHLPGLSLRLSYLYDRQVYTDYTERLTSGTLSRTFDRSGRLIPGIVPHFVNARLSYDGASGRLRGLGGFVETNVRNSFYLDNANLLKASGYSLVNVGLHYQLPEGRGLASRLSFYFELQNVGNDRWIASASNITNSLDAETSAENPASVLANSTGSIYAGTPRASFGGVRLRF